IVASPYGEYHFSNDYSGMILINKGPVTSNVPGASYGWDCGNWNNAPNTTSTGFILGHQTGEHSGYAVAGGSNIDGGRAIVIGRPYETGTLSQVAVLFSRDINTTNKTPSPIKSNLIDMSQTGDPTGTKGKTDMNNFGLLIKNIPGAYAAAGPATPPANFLPVNGMSLACGDVTGDGNEDIIIGCPHDSGNVGSVYVISGNGGGLWNDNDYTNAPVNIDISTSAPPAVYKISGINANDYFGASVLAADIYGGNDKELIIGAPGAQGKGGAVIIADAKAKITGGANFSIADVALAAFAVASPNSSNGRRMGHAMAAGKFHDSGAAKNDLVITEFVDDDSASNAYVVYGKVATPAAGAVVTVDVTIKPFKNNEKFGYAVACGDINGDNFHDIAVTAPRGYKIDTEAGEQRGRVCVLHGMPYATGTVIDLSDGTKPFYGSIFQTQGNYGRNHQSTTNNYFGFGVAIGDVGGPDT
nr:hypothetical protein [Candidatus Wallbacteria bacterium]